MNLNLCSYRRFTTGISNTLPIPAPFSELAFTVPPSITILPVLSWLSALPVPIPAPSLLFAVTTPPLIRISSTLFPAEAPRQLP